MPYDFVPARWFTAGAIREVRALVVHMAEGGGTVGYFRTTTRNVSSHYVIEYSGRIVQMVRDGDASHTQHKSTEPYKSADFGTYSPDVARAVLGDGWADPNRYVHAVEIEGFRAAGPNPAQAASLQALVADLRSRFPLRGLLGHRDIQDKPCPGGLIPWASLGGHGLFGTGDDMDVKLKAEDWIPTVTDGQSNGVFRERADRTAPLVTVGGSVLRVPTRTVVRSVAEVDTQPGVNAANDEWRLTRLPDGRTVYLNRETDWTPVTLGGDPVLDAALGAFIARTPPTQVDCTPLVEAARAEGYTKGVTDGTKSGYRAGAGKVGERVRNETLAAAGTDVDRIVTEETA